MKKQVLKINNVVSISNTQEKNIKQLGGETEVTNEQT